MAWMGGFGRFGPYPRLRKSRQSPPTEQRLADCGYTGPSLGGVVESEHLHVRKIGQLGQG